MSLPDPCQGCGADFGAHRWSVRTIPWGRPDTIEIRVKNVRYASYGYDDIQTNRWTS
jgi:hypothetical protein